MGKPLRRWQRNVTRESADELTVASHHKAVAAMEAGHLADEVCPVTLPGGELVTTDGLLRPDTSMEKLARLRPVFDRKTGSLTAGNSTALTDGAGAVLLMSEEKARALGYTPLAAFRSWSYVGVDPSDQLLIGPAVAMPHALERAGMELSDIDFVDMHEAFAAQVLCVLQALASDGWARHRLDRDRAVGQVDMTGSTCSVVRWRWAIPLQHRCGGATMSRHLHRTGMRRPFWGFARRQPGRPRCWAV